MDSYTPCYDIAVDLIDITTSMEQQVPITNSFGLYTVDFAAGLLGGWAGLIIGHPFDTIKVRQQTQWQGCRTIVQCFQATTKTEGLRGFYRGMSFPLVSVGFLNSLFFGIYGNSLRVFGKHDERRGVQDYSYGAVFLAGAIGGGIQAIPASPIELVKIKLQSSSGNQHVTSASASASASVAYKGPIHCLHDIYRTAGLRGTFRGLSLTVLREIPGFAIYVTVYEWLTSNWRSEDQKICTVPTMLFAGGLAGVASWLVNIPIDIVKSRLQSDDLLRPRYSSIRDCALQLYRSEGLLAFWRGLPAVCIRSFPCNAVTFAVYTLSVSFLAASLGIVL